jgi:hypothetical protein
MCPAASHVPARPAPHATPAQRSVRSLPTPLRPAPAQPRASCLPDKMAPLVSLPPSPRIAQPSASLLTSVLRPPLLVAPTGPSHPAPALTARPGPSVGAIPRTRGRLLSLPRWAHALVPHPRSALTVAALRLPPWAHSSVSPSTSRTGRPIHRRDPRAASAPWARTRRILRQLNRLPSLPCDPSLPPQPPQTLVPQPPCSPAAQWSCATADPTPCFASTPTDPRLSSASMPQSTPSPLLATPRPCSTGISLVQRRR